MRAIGSVWAKNEVLLFRVCKGEGNPKNLFLTLEGLIGLVREVEGGLEFKEKEARRRMFIIVRS